MSISNPEFSSSTLLNPVEVSGPEGEHKKSLGVMMLAAIGVVFGDIGTRRASARRADRPQS